MTLPGFLLGTLAGALVGGLFHLAVGGHLGRLLLYLIFGVVGFWLGDLLAEIFGITFLSYGSVRMGAAILFSIAFTAFCFWLSLVQNTKK